MPEVVLVADKTVLSEYNDTPFYGFMSCLPKGFIPKRVYNWLVPPVKVHDNGEVKYATLSLRKVEACLLNKGISVAVTDQENIDRVINDQTKIVGVSSIDPLGKAPGSHVMRMFIKGDQSLTNYEFTNLMSKVNALKKKHSFKTIISGAGAWQLVNTKIGDHVFLGEAEATFPGTAKQIINGQSTPRIIKGLLPKAGQIPSIKKPTIAGLIETARGCGRGCRFCSTTLSGMIRSLSKEKVLEEVRVNLSAGKKDITIQSEDFLSYKAGKDFRPNSEAVYDLFKSIFDQGARSVRTIHANLSSIASSPDLMSKLTKLMRKHGQKRGFCQPGIETGSQSLMNKLMKGKLKPLINEDWSSIIKQAFKICNDNNWFILATMIFGLPGETKDDVRESIRVIESIKPYKSVIATLFFVPIELTSLRVAKNFVLKKMSKDHWVLLKKCWQHNLKHITKVNLGRGPINLLGKFIARRACKSMINKSESEITGVKVKPGLIGRLTGLGLKTLGKL